MNSSTSVSRYSRIPPIAAMLHRTQQLGIDPRQPRQCVCIQPIVFLPALPDQMHLARMGHDHLCPNSPKRRLIQGGMCPGLQRHPAARHGTEDFAQRCRSRADSLLQLYRPTRSNRCDSPRSNPMVSFCCEKFLLCCFSVVLPFFIAGLLFIYALRTSITWERTASRPETGLLRANLISHLFSTFWIVNLNWPDDRTQKP